MAISSVGSNARPGVCTSTTRPTAPFEGQLIYETDTDMLAIWNGSAWRYVGQSSTTADSNLDAVGLRLVTPTSVAGSGVTLSGSKIVATNATSISANGCFTSDFQHYKILLDGEKNSDTTGVELQFQMRAAGTPTGGTGYIWRGVNQNSTSAPINQSSNGTSYFYAANGGSTAAGSIIAEMTVLNPQTTRRTGWVCITHFSWAGDADYYYRHVSGQLTNTISYDGFTLLSSGNGINARITIYGYND